MVRGERWEKLLKAQSAVHGKVEMTYSLFYDEDGSPVFQINTSGPSSDGGAFKGKTEQSIRFGPEGIRELQTLLNGL